MASEVLARNLLIHQQAQSLATAFSQAGLQSVLLKGCALTSCFPAYSRSREMEDIDMLVRPASLPAARDLLLSLGYSPAQEDPHAMMNASLPASVDLSGALWYLDRRENEKVFSESFGFPLDGMSGAFFHLKPEDFYIHVLAHGALHHAEDNPKWKRDLTLIWENWGKLISWREVEGKLKAYGFQKAAAVYLSPYSSEDSFYKRLLFSRNNPNKGHVTRFMYLPLRKKTSYIFSSLFPAEEFLLRRYSSGNRGNAAFLRLLRPFSLAAGLASVFYRLLYRGTAAKKPLNRSQ